MRRWFNGESGPVASGNATDGAAKDELPDRVSFTPSDSLSEGPDAWRFVNRMFWFALLCLKFQFTMALGTSADSW